MLIGGASDVVQPTVADLTNLFTGSVADLRTYPYALTAAQVTALTSAMRGNRDTP
ncbi:hypothetical protein ACEZDB_05355 [Streptacidiphilus sp. N1-3]|uniref:Uncharacterized protein n=1 Tax=Streptacidiphilus alkalitolerans TaxID=3342712 RepID=A0ABV6WVL4_9ACTN